MLREVRGHADVLEGVDWFLKVVAELLHFVHLVGVEPVVPPIPACVSLPPMSIEITGIKLIIRPAIILFKHNLLQQLLNGHPIILHIGSIQVPHDIHQLIRGEKSIAVVIVEPEQLFALGLGDLTVDAEALEDQSEEVVELVDGDGVGAVEVRLVEAVARDGVGLLAGFVAH